MDKKSLMLIVGNNLQSLRSERNFTQEEVAEKIGISTSFYANLERGKKGISNAVLREIAACLGVTVDYLLYETHTDARIRNIETLLKDKPISFVISMEKLIRLCIEEFTDEIRK
ncbi:MAG: helix-turn-helix domain-containing protein [Oscillospiraceae bacterium]|jgi:putative transcriptional regulator